MLKRKRDPTFTLSERTTLVNLVKKRFSIIEAKKTDAFTINKKNEEWCKIATEFNCLSNVQTRKWTVLKNCWENLKKRAKQVQILRNQRLLSKVGGPPLQKIKDDPIINRVLELIQTRVTGFVNIYDSDAPKTLGRSNTEHVLSSSSSSSSSSASPTNKSQNPKESNPSNLYTLRAKPLEKDKDYAEEENELKIKILRIQVEKEKEILKQERFKTEQELFKLEILKLQLKKLKD